MIAGLAAVALAAPPLLQVDLSLAVADTPPVEAAALLGPGGRFLLEIRDPAGMSAARLVSDGESLAWMVPADGVHLVARDADHVLREATGLGLDAVRGVLVGEVDLRPLGRATSEPGGSVGGVALPAHLVVELDALGLHADLACSGWRVPERVAPDVFAIEPRAGTQPVAVEEALGNAVRHALER